MNLRFFQRCILLLPLCSILFGQGRSLVLVPVVICGSLDVFELLLVALVNN